MADENVTQGAEPEPEEDRDRDSIVKMLGEAENYARRMKQHPPATAEAIATQLSGTVLELVKDMIQKQLDLYDMVVGALDDLDDRLAGVESGLGPEGPSDEETSKLREYVAFTGDMLDHIIPTLEGDVRAKAEEMRKLGTECAAIIETFAGSDEDEEGEGDEPETSGEQN